MLAAILQARHTLHTTAPYWVLDGLDDAHKLLTDQTKPKE